MDVLLVGGPVLRSGLTVTAEEIARGCAETGRKFLDELTGSYHLVARHREEGWAVLQTDRQGTLPWFYRRTDSGIHFSTSARGVLAMGGDVRPSSEGALSFLREGYPLTRQSMFAGIHRMAPGHRWVLDIATGASKEEAYWKLRFHPRRTGSLDEAAAALYARTLDAHRVATNGFEDSFGMFLTGGIDSRGMAGALAELGRVPQRCLTWCGRERVPYGDPDVAGRIAHHYGFPHHVVHLDADSLEQNARTWLRMGELTTDNLGFFTSAPDVFRLADVEQPAFYLVGDELFGHGGEPADVLEAVSYILKSANARGADWLRGCVRNAGPGEGRFQEALQSLREEFAGLHPRDIVDWMTYYVHRPCWSYSAGNCKLPAVAVRRPFMDDAIVDMVSGLPREYRSDKTVYYQMLRRHLPKTLAFPRASADSLFDWPRRFRTHAPTRQMLQKALHHDALLSGPVAEVLDPDRIREYAGQYFDQPVSSTSGRTFGHVGVNIRRALQRQPWARPAVRSLSGMLRKPKRPTRLNPTHLIRRFALLSLFLQEVESGGFSGSSPQ